MTTPMILFCGDGNLGEVPTERRRRPTVADVGRELGRLPTAGMA